jgi:ubiquinone/menaquinone biosynthesis C-methylase UbiE
MAQHKDTDNTPLVEIDRLTKPATSTMIDRYVIANHWTKGKTVIDAATGKGYGAGILLSLGAKSVVGIDIDEGGVRDANEIYQSPNIGYKVCDIFNLKDEFKENEFEVCTSIETFEHLPPERIDEYLQSIKYVTSDTVIITTPRRQMPVWNYQGGTHLYEYDVNEFTEILNRNFDGDDISAIGINEIQLPGGQWGSDITTDLNTCWIFFAVIERKK